MEKFSSIFMCRIQIWLKNKNCVIFKSTKFKTQIDKKYWFLLHLRNYLKKNNFFFNIFQILYIFFFHNKIYNIEVILSKIRQIFFSNVIKMLKYFSMSFNSNIKSRIFNLNYATVSDKSKTLLNNTIYKMWLIYK